MSNPLEALYWRDEILQILYWFRGEGLGDAVTPREVAGFVQAEDGMVQQRLEELVAESLVAKLGDAQPRYRLTEQGVKEGGRRFAEEFAGLTGQAHGECSDPNCVCHTQGPESCGSAPPGPHVQ